MIQLNIGIGVWIFAAILIVAAVAALMITRKIRDFSKQVFGTEKIVEGINRQSDIAAETPKSVSSMTRLMEPQIVKDFPDFVWEEFRHKAENMLSSALLAVTAGDIDRLVEASPDVRNQISNIIEENRATGIKETYRDVRIHRTEIANYRKEGGKCIITIQSAVEYYHYKEENGSVIAGSRERKKQTKYNIELIYIQDVDAFDGGNALGITCPNCGAPVRSLGNMVCEYCGSKVTPLNIKIWSLHKLYQVDYNHSY